MTHRDRWRDVETMLNENRPADSRSACEYAIECPAAQNP